MTMKTASILFYSTLFILFVPICDAQSSIYNVYVVYLHFGRVESTSATGGNTEQQHCKSFSFKGEYLNYSCMINCNILLSKYMYFTSVNLLL